MRNRLVGPAAIVIAAAIGLAACSTSLSVTEYADEMAGVADAYVVEAQELSYDYQSRVEDGVRALIDASEGSDDVEAEAVGLVRASTLNYLSLLGDAMGRYASAMEEIPPPAEVVDEHDAYLAAVGAVLTALPSTRSAVGASESLDEIGLAINTSGFADGQIRWTISCTALEQAVRDEGRGINLKCEQEAPLDG